MHLCDVKVGDLVILADTAAIYLGLKFLGYRNEQDDYGDPGTKRAVHQTIWYAPKLTQFLPNFPIYTCDFAEGAWFKVIGRVDDTIPDSVFPAG